MHTYALSIVKITRYRVQKTRVCLEQNSTTHIRLFFKKFRTFSQQIETFSKDFLCYRSTCYEASGSDQFSVTVVYVRTIYKSM